MNLYFTYLGYATSATLLLFLARAIAREYAREIQIARGGRS